METMDWKTERRTGTDLILERAANSYGSVAAFERALGLNRGYVSTVISEGRPGFGRATTRKIANALSLPYIAVAHRNEPICKLVREERKACA